MRWIVSRSLHFRWIVIFLAGTFMAFSLAEIPESKVDVFPEFAPPQVEVQTIALGNSTAEVESLVTVPIEEALNGIPGLDEMRSKSVAQLSSIRLIFKKGTNEARARQLVQERVAQVVPNIPTWASPPWMMPALSATSRIMKIGVTSDQVDLIDLSSISYWKIRQHLLRVPGVAGVDIYGERLKQRHVQVDPDLLAKYDIPIDTVMEAGSEALDSGVLQYAKSFTVGQGGFVETATQRLNIENVQPITGPEDLAKVPVAKRGDQVLRMSDLGDVKQDSQQLWGEGVINDGDGLMLIVQKYRGANTKEVTEHVEEVMQEMAPGLPGIEYDTTIFRPATFIEESIDNLTLALLLGVLLVIVIISAFLYTIRTAFISLISIPLSLLAAYLVLDVREVTINVMVLAGLVVAIGVVVDDAIIDVENIVRRLRQAKAEGTDKSTVKIVLEASVEIRSAITYATIINVVAIVPVLFLGGLSGSFFQPLVLSYGLAVFISMLVAMTVTPALCLALLHRGSLREKESPVLRVLKRGYSNVLKRVLRRPAPSMVGAVAIALAGVLIYPTLGTQLLPNFKERDFLMHWLTEPSTSITQEKRVSVEACQDLRAIPGVRNCGSHIGQALLSDEVYGAYFGENWISVSDQVDYDKTLDKVTDTVDSYPGMQRDVQTYLRERVKEVLTGSSGAVVVRIFGPDPRTLTELADKTLKAIGDTPDLIEAAAAAQKEIPQIEIELDLEKARKHDLKPGDIRRQSSVYIAGEEVSDIFSGGRAYDVHVWSLPESRHSYEDIKNLPIDTPAGDKVKLSDVADVRFAPSPNAILRDDQSRRIDVEGNIAEGGDLGAVVEEVEKRVAALDLPPEYSVKVLGESSELTKSQNTLAVYGLVALLAIFLLLHAAFGSLRLAGLAFLLLPVSLVGGVLAVALSGGLMSLGSLIGFLTVFGIAARNGILMINHFQHLEREEGVPFGRELVMRGASERLAPIMMTALATALAIVPLAAAGSIPGHEIEHPMALVILGGLLTATLVNLFIIPSLYLRFAKSRRERRQVSGSASPAPA
ncbi:efflux RND transporter permease subunit [Aeromicrobium sp.]|uniref:efflux RND transporter permease subunit n=1 Tax=Aeromicrobium sp. TaxID=1871063 RepID=UPI003C650547